MLPPSKVGGGEVERVFRSLRLWGRVEGGGGEGGESSGALRVRNRGEVRVRVTRESSPRDDLKKGSEPTDVKS